jgi:putative endonuclease
LPRDKVLGSAESKDPGDAYLTHAVRSFSTTEPAPDIRTAIAREKQLKGWRRAKKLNLIGAINPEFKDLAQTWGWKMITEHEKMYP